MTKESTALRVGFHSSHRLTGVKAGAKGLCAFESCDKNVESAVLVKASTRTHLCHDQWHHTDSQTHLREPPSQTALLHFLVLLRVAQKY